jgi:hypothetical protein
MSSQRTPAELAQVRSLLQRLDEINDSRMDTHTLESLKNVMRNNLRALEIVLEKVSTLPAAPPE